MQIEHPKFLKGPDLANPNAFCPTKKVVYNYEAPVEERKNDSMVHGAWTNPGIFSHLGKLYVKRKKTQRTITSIENAKKYFQK